MSAETCLMARVKQDESRDRPPTGSQRKLLLSSYMNSGSSFTGSLFGHRDDAFYFYEPLWTFGVFSYFRSPNTECDTLEDPTNCRNSTRVADLLEILDDIYHCKFSSLGHIIVPSVHGRSSLSGTSWLSFHTCMKNRAPKQECLKILETTCHNSAHVVTKVLRLTTWDLRSLLERNQNLKVIHQFRNPFAIINSRSETKGYPAKNFSLNADILCNKMKDDFQGVRTLKDTFPNRVKMIFYEDLKTDIETKVRKLFDFVGMHFDRNAPKQLINVKINDANSNITDMNKNRIKDNARWWRSYMSFRLYEQVLEKCTEVVRLLNITTFKNRAEMFQTNIPDLKLSEEMSI
ncbi:carbohydrate sulfotransferase 4-like isoform X2 [Dreissena polymorpha]|nr:carbohydrate sulfotransferase 4-like isoform X2 [Dreissena polymorpha]